MVTEKPGFNMSEADLLSLVGQVQTELANIAKNESGDGTRLAKSDEDGGEPEPKPEEGSGSAPAEGSGPPPSAPPSAPPGEGAPPSEPPMGEPPPGEGAPPGPDGAGAGAGAGPSFEELVTLYTQLPPEDFEAHAAAIQQAAQMRSAGGPGQGAGAPPPPAAGPSAPPPSAPPGPGPSAGAPAFKSEAKVKELEAQLAKMQKSMAEQTTVIEALGKVVTAPQRKAVTGITFIPMQKAEETKSSRKPFAQLSKAELHSALTEMTAGPGLNKSERDLISGFYHGNVKREALADLFKEQK